MIRRALARWLHRAAHWIDPGPTSEHVEAELRYQELSARLRMLTASLDASLAGHRGQRA